MKHIDKKAITVWRITNGIIFAIMVLIFITINILRLYFDWIPQYVVWIFVVILIIEIVWSLILEPTIAYHTHLYELRDDELILENGIFIKIHTKIPLVRIQNVETSVGPIMKRFQLKSVMITTAGGSRRIEMINETEAEALKREITKQIKQHERKQWQ